MAKNGDTPKAREWWRKGKPGRLKSSMAGLSAAAIVAVYAAGYVSSDAASQDDGAALPAKVTLAATATPSAPSPTTPNRTGGAPVATPRTGTTGGATAPRAATPTPTAAPAQGSAVRYADGVYTGSGTGRHGGMTVSVQVTGGKIVAVDITQCGTRYPCDRIASLPARVVTAQSPEVAYVSRATDSSVAFMRAVQAALSKAAV